MSSKKSSSKKSSSSKPAVNSVIKPADVKHRHDNTDFEAIGREVAAVKVQCKEVIDRARAAFAALDKASTNQ